MHSDSVVYTIFLIFSGAAVLATVALYARQAMLVAYIVVGIALGPSGIGLVRDSNLTDQIAHIGIMFLLFLLGLNMYPQKLITLVEQTTLITGVSSLIFAILGAGLGWLLGFTWLENLIIGGTLMFSSTIIGLKLLPTTVLHHRHTGEIIISILLLQDLIAIVILLILQARGQEDLPWLEMIILLLSLPGLILFAYLFFRLGQISEFSLLIAVLALEREAIGHKAAYLIQLSPILTFIVSTYLIVLRFPTPIAVSDHLRRD